MEKERGITRHIGYLGQDGLEGIANAILLMAINDMMYPHQSRYYRQICSECGWEIDTKLNRCGCYIDDKNAKPTPCRFAREEVRQFWYGEFGIWLREMLELNVIDDLDDVVRIARENS